MKKKLVFFAAVLAICLTACSFFNKTEQDNKLQSVSDNSVVTYSCQVSLSGGSGRASVNSPATVVETDGKRTVELIWSSSNYDYMLVEGQRFDNEASEGDNSKFTIPFAEYDKAFKVIGDTTAMSQPHEIEYELTVSSPKTSGLPLEGEGGPGDLRSEPTVAEAEKKLTDEVSSAEAEKKLSEALKKSGLSKTGSMTLEYATQYTVDYFEDGSKKQYALITIGSGDYTQHFLKSLKNAPEPKGLSSDITFLGSVDKTYLVSTSVMDLISSVDALDNISFTGTKASEWYVSSAKKSMKKGDIIYAGKYSAPDYELLLTDECNLAIENTMIYHTPAVKEKLESLGIPVMVELSSYESHPLGRLEWIKLYGLLYDKMEEADNVFTKQVKGATAFSNTGTPEKSVAVFSVTSKGIFVIRKPGDYIATMINMAGGKYVPEKIKGTDENALSTMKITSEDFFIYAGDADILIYNSTVEGEVESTMDLIKKNQILADFKAVKDGQVYCLSKEYFQASSNVAEFIEDMNKVLNGQTDSLTYIFKLKE
ncbi:iron complex transport system substrate-binding protein [Pseudobutyrivibrio sp. YE44]|uniref:ABC transporter substrate-binding protein n=1 Tax=Pseudobutyrivibrio sp. YE44 TaxID=1520802 RepID=UPI00088C6B11|nr:ABC transporter substrate-binding protein [Pseudobutyrivibrio sp. YE44]SDB05787.1 iron complex transport system substrate-binding protein [Pseudobutyrivibrio sp. YE44]